MENYCITHDIGTSYGVDDYAASGCLIVTCPPPEFDMSDEWVDSLEMPTDDELLVMYLNSLELEEDFVGESNG